MLLLTLLTEAISWPPDLVGLLWMLLQRTGMYRYVATPPATAVWPPRADWDDYLSACADEWLHWASLNRRTAIPRTLRVLLEELANCADHVEIDRLQHQQVIAKTTSPRWSVITSSLTLFAVADVLCAGLGFYGPTSETDSRIPGKCSRRDRTWHRMRMLGNLLLATNGTLSRLPKHVVTVVPKLKTPQRGLGIRCLSHHATCYAGEVNLLWRTVPFTSLGADALNMLLVPHPTAIEPSWFKSSRVTSHGRRRARDFYFSYDAECELDTESLINALIEAGRTVGHVDIIAFPELSLTPAELERLERRLTERALDIRSVPAILTGLRGSVNEAGGTNAVSFSRFFAGKWYRSVQRKQHRWRLTKEQLCQYGFGASLSPAQDWWEELEIHQRRQTVLLAAPWLAIAPLICEDLAQEEPTTDLLRAIAPTLVFAALLDGPQLPERWPGRHANVLADDPGSAVLTLTSYGMARRSRRNGELEPPVGKTSIALWRDSTMQWCKVEQDDDRTLHLLTAAARYTEEWTADGRSDNGATSSIALRQVAKISSMLTRTRTKADSEAHHPADAHEPTRKGYAEETRDLQELTRLVFLADFWLTSEEDVYSGIGELVSIDAQVVEQDSSLLSWLGASSSLRRATTDITQMIRERIAPIGKQHERSDLAWAVDRLRRLLLDWRRQWSSRDREAPDGQRQTWRELDLYVRDRLLILAASIKPDSTEAHRHSFDRLLDQAQKFGIKKATALRVEWLVGTTVLFCIRSRLETRRNGNNLDRSDEEHLSSLDDYLASGCGLFDVICYLDEE